VFEGLPLPNQWTWWIVAVVLLVLEIFAPTSYLLWLGIAAGIVGFVVLLVSDMGLNHQLLLFAVLAVVCTVAGRLWIKRRPISTENPTLNRRGSQYVGRVFTLREPICDGIGKVHVDDTIWKATGPDLPAGARVRVTGLDGTVLTLESAEER
jgi:membrane protein implicated in regulation of membrane protease activity